MDVNVRYENTANYQFTQLRREPIVRPAQGVQRASGSVTPPYPQTNQLQAGHQVAVRNEVVATYQRSLAMTRGTTTTEPTTTRQQYYGGAYSQAPAPLQSYTVSDETLDRLVSSINDTLALTAANRRLEHGVHEGTNTILVRVVDSETNEVIREIPPEERVDAMYRLRSALGLTFDQAV